MAASGYTPVIIYNSGTTTNVPLAANLASGELAVNYADGKLFFKNSGGTVTNFNVTVNGTTIGLGTSATVTAAAGTLTGTTLNSSVVSSSLTSVGTIGTGVWQGTAIGVAYGGTGLTSTPANGALDIGNGSGFTRTTLTAGTGISISNSSGGITITNTSTSSGGTVTSVSGTGTVNGITLTGTVTSSGSLTLGGTLSGVSLTSQVSGTLPIANGGTNSTATPTAGGVGYGTGSAHAYTAAGSSGQVLTSSGSGAPTWASPSSGAMTLISKFTANNTTNVASWTGLSGYSSYIMILDVGTSVGDILNVQIGNGAGPTYITSGYYVRGEYSSSSLSALVASAFPNSAYQLAGTLSTSVFEGQLFFTGMSGSSGNSGINYIGGYASAQVASNSSVSNSSAVTAIKIFTQNSNNFYNGTISLYGIT